MPPLFIDQMAQVLARHLVGTGHDPFRARAAGLLFREQQATIADGAILPGAINRQLTCWVPRLLKMVVLDQWANY